VSRILVVVQLSIFSHSVISHEW